MYEKKSQVKLDNTTTGRSTPSPPPDRTNTKVVGTVLLANNCIGLYVPVQQWTVTHFVRNCPAFQTESTYLPCNNIVVSPTASGVVSQCATMAHCSQGMPSEAEWSGFEHSANNLT